MIKPGVYPADCDYAAIDAVNISRLLLLDVSPLHYRSASHRDTKPMRMGTAYHCATLEPDRFDRDYIVWESTYRGGEKVGNKVKKPGDLRPRSGSSWENFRVEAERHGTIVLTDSERQEAHAFAKAVRTDPIASQILAHGRAEQVLVWEMDGIACKGRVDWIEEPSATGHAIDDLKSAKDITPRRFAIACARYRYHVRMAWYALGYQSITGVYPSVALIAAESEEPHDVCVYDYPDDVLAIGEDECHRLVARLKVCQDSGEWLGVSGGTRKILALPAWEMPDDSDLSDLGLEDDRGKEETYQLRRTLPGPIPESRRTPGSASDTDCF